MKTRIVLLSLGSRSCILARRTQPRTQCFLRRPTFARALALLPRFAWQAASPERYPRRSRTHSRLSPAPTAFFNVGNAKIAAPIVFTTQGNNVDRPPMTRLNQTSTLRHNLYILDRCSAH